MNFFRTSALLLVAAVLVAGRRDFSRNFGGASSRLLRDATSGSGSSYGVDGTVQRFTQGFGGQSSLSKSVSYEPFYAGSSNQDGGFRPRYGYSGNSDSDDASSSSSQKARTLAKLFQNIADSGARDDSDARSSGFRGYGSNVSSGLRTSFGSRNGFSGSRALNLGFGASGYGSNGNYGFGSAASSIPGASSVPAVLLAFPFLTSVSYGVNPYGTGFGLSGNDYSAGLSGAYRLGYGYGFAGAGNSAAGFSDNDYSAGLSGAYRSGSGYGFAGAGNSAAGYSDNDYSAGLSGAYRSGSGYGFAGAGNSAAGYSDNDYSAGLSGAYRSGSGYGFAGQDDSADFDNARSYTGTSYSGSSSDNGNAGVGVVLLAGGSAKGNEAGSGPRHTKTVRTTVTTESESADANKSAAGGELRAAVLPVVAATSYGSNSASSDNSASLSGLGAANFADDGSASSSFTATPSGSYFGGRSGSYRRLGGYGANSAASATSSSASLARAFSASSSQADAYDRSALN